MLFRPENEIDVEIYGWVLFEHHHPKYPKSFHLAGMVNGTGRVCSPLKAVVENEDEYIFFSRSGKKYVAPKKYYRGDSVEYLSPDAKHVLNSWLSINSGTSKDTTVENFIESLNEENQ